MTSQLAFLHSARSHPPAKLHAITAATFLAFLAIGLALPVLPLHVYGGLHLGTLFVGLVAGSQFAASVVSRPWAGRHADIRGSKHAVVMGLSLSAMAGLLYLISLRFVALPAVSVAILLLGRALLGAGESFVITGAQAWGLALAGAENTGKVLAWLGTAMYAAFAIGAPAGTTLYASWGFGAIAIATTFVPLAALLLVSRLQPVAPIRRQRPGFAKVFAAVWLPGLGLALSSLGFGAITAFVGLLFQERGWMVWPAFTTFAVAFVLARLCLGHLADRRGGANVALICMLVEATGLAVVWLAPSSTMALIGSALTGFGYSLVYPGLGIEAVRRAPPHVRGLAMGTYTAFLDVALGLASPALGLIASSTGLASVFCISAAIVLCGAAVAMRLLSSPACGRDSQPTTVAP